MDSLKPNLVQPGDIFVVDGGSWLDNIIEWGQNPLGKWARWSHTGIILSEQGSILETTDWRTAIRSLPECYAGSRLKILRWPGMTTEAAMDALDHMLPQVGRIYPYWRLLTHLFRVQGWLHGTAMECSTLSASFLKAAGFPLKHSPWWYGPRTLADEMQEAGCEIVFNGSLREAGYIIP